MSRQAEIHAAVAAALDALDEDRTPLDLVGEIPLIEAATEEITAARVEAARSQGLSWEAIAQRLGISRQAAHKRFGRPKGRRKVAPPRRVRLELRLDKSKRADQDL